MEANPKQQTGTAERTLRITRTFDAPPEVVFRMWTDVNHLVHWWGPKGFTTPFHEMDVRPGGNFRFCLRSPEGAEYWMQGTYREVAVPERLAFTFAWEDADGSPGHQTLITVTFEGDGGKTRMTFHQELFTSVEERDSHHSGWTESFDRLEAYLATS